MAKPKQIRRRGRLSLLLGTIVAALLGAAVAFADNPVSDGDGVTPVADQNMTVGSVACGVATNKTALVAVQRNGAAGSTNVFKNGSTVTISVLSVSGAGLSANISGSNTIALPSDWGSRANNTVSPGSVSSTVTVNSSVAGPGSGSVTYRATGVNSDNQTITRTDTMGVTWTTGSCTPVDSTPPVISPNVQGTLGDNGWYTSNVRVTWNVSDGESTISSSTGCGETNITADTAGTTVTCQATSAGGTNSNSVTIKRDATAPSVTVQLARSADHNGWYNHAVGYSITSSTDAMSGIASCDSADTFSGPDDGNASVALGCTDKAGNPGSDSVSFQYDATAPTIQGSRNPGVNANGWNKTSVAVSYACGDATSGIDTCGPNETLVNEGANQSSSGTAMDNAGNSASDTVSGINIDKTNPSVSLVGGPADGGSYYFGFVPATPTCEASDALSGLDGACQVSGYSNAIGSHTVKAEAKDKAGNTNSDSHSYSVLAWTLRGFYQPVDMGSNVVNTVKNGSTVPLKFEIFVGANELSDTASVKSLTQQIINCTSFSGDAADEIEAVATGGTVLRYDATSGQYVYNWKTPAQAGKCYVVKVTTQDGSSLSAQFKLK